MNLAALSIGEGLSELNSTQEPDGAHLMSRGLGILSYS